MGPGLVPGVRPAPLGLPWPKRSQISGPKCGSHTLSCLPYGKGLRAGLPLPLAARARDTHLGVCVHVRLRSGEVRPEAFLEVGESERNDMDRCG